MNIQNEDDLLYMLYKQRNAYSGIEAYPKVSEIPKGKDNTITPDIDLLEVPISPDGEVIGYEVKVLRYRKTGNSFSLGGFYQGLGQSLCYLQHGVERVVLILGLYGVPKEKSNVLDITEEKLKQTMKRVHENFLVSSPHVVVQVCRQDRKEPVILTSSTRSFDVRFNLGIRYKYECLTRRKFTWARKWLKEMSEKRKELKEDEKGRKS